MSDVPQGSRSPISGRGTVDWQNQTYEDKLKLWQPRYNIAYFKMHINRTWDRVPQVLEVASKDKNIDVLTATYQSSYWKRLVDKGLLLQSTPAPSHRTPIWTRGTWITLYPIAVLTNHLPIPPRYSGYSFKPMQVPFEMEMVLPDNKWQGQQSPANAHGSRLDGLKDSGLIER